MKLRKGQRHYKIQQVGELLHACIDEGRKGGYRFVVQQMSWDDFLELKSDKKLRGRPSKMILLNDAKEIAVWPTPDTAYELVIRYHPPAREQ